MFESIDTTTPELPTNLSIFAGQSHHDDEAGHDDDTGHELDLNDDTPAFLNALAAKSSATTEKAAVTSEYEDGQLVYVPASMLLDMKCGNLFKRKSSTPELKEDIRKNGIISSVPARPHPTKAGFLELIAGYGRRDIALELGIEVPVMIRLVDDRTALMMHRNENMLRSGHSFGDEVRLTREWLTLFDSKETAQSLSGWSVTKFNERVEMLKAIPAVLDALDEGQIQIKHALILSSFDDEVQANTLAKVIAEKWSVAELKQRADKVVVSLSLAIFDRVDCTSCKHNTVRQSDLFDMGEVAAGCAKSSCFKAKTDAELASRKQAAEERFGRVIFLSEFAESDRTTVTADAVGAEQFASGCAGCTDNVVMINDKLGKNTGALTNNQCVNLTCFTKCANAQKDAVASEEKAAKKEQAKALKSDSLTDIEPTASNAPAATEPKESKPQKTVVVGSYTQPVLEAHQKELRVHSANHLQNNPVFAEAMKAYSLMNVAGCPTKSQGKYLIASLMEKSVEELVKVQEMAISFLLRKTQNVNSVAAWNFLTSAAKVTETGEDALVTAWEPEEAAISKYTTVQLELLAKDSGLSAAQPEAFKKAVAGKKADLVKFVLDAKGKGFDWTAYAPTPYLSELKKK
jgi:PRTRC genetic system ParB family protein